MKIKTFLLVPFLAFHFLASGCTDNKKIEVVGDELLKYLNFNVDYLIDEKPSITTLYLTLEIIPKQGYKVEKIACTVSCSVSYTYKRLIGTEISENKTIKVINFDCKLKKEHVCSGSEIIYAYPYFESLISDRNGVPTCTLVRV